MKHRTQLIAIVGLIIFGSISVPAGASNEPVVGRHGTELVTVGSLLDHQISGGTARQQAEIRYGIYLYAREGLYMPQLRIYIHDSRELCHGHSGLYNADDLGDRIDICTEGIVLHELAHAWEYHNVDDAARQAFVDHAGLPTWDDHSYSHGSRGVEKAAEAISWGIGSDRLDADQVETYDGWLKRYQLLVGQPSPKIAHMADSSPETRRQSRQPKQENAAAPSPAISVDPTVVFEASSDQRLRAINILERFAELGMQLPDMRVRFHTNQKGCDGHKGLFDSSTDPWTLEICSELEYVVAHEVGHAWELANLTAQDRNAYMAERGIAEWQNINRPTNEQGVEDVAFNIQKAILQGPTVNESVTAAFGLIQELANDETRAESLNRSEVSWIVATVARLIGAETPAAFSAPLDPYGLYGADESERAAIERDIHLVTSAGLRLPELRIYVHDSRDSCAGHRGIYSQEGDVHRIDLCEVSAALEELVHAWEYHNMEEDTRQAYIETEGVRWNRSEDDHHQRGVEMAAQAIMWGLRGHTIQAHLLNLYQAELATYYMLTSKLPPRLDDAARVRLTVAWALNRGEVRPSRTTVNHLAGLDFAFSAARGFAL